MQFLQEFCDFLKSYLSDTEFYVEAMPGDAGSRIYWRIYTAKQNYILSYNPNNYLETQLFIELTKYLRQYNFSVPYIYYQDLNKGLLLIEDFGTHSLNRNLISLNSKARIPFYQLAINLLIELHQVPLPAFIANLSTELMIQELNVFKEYYIPYKFGRVLSDTDNSELNVILHQLFTSQRIHQKVLSLQDYHVDNIMLLKERDSTKSLGLLDYQDAKNSSPIYDLVSLLEDARIEVPRKQAIEYLNYYAKQTSSNFNDVFADYHILGLQRNCRILGVFVRKYKKGCNDYLKFLPLVEKYLSYNLLHPVAYNFKKWFVSLSNI
ncbi:MAG: phosphotransferase [Rickettsiaceae bacterium]|nr:phosphotransferase [Rickettsiaceae bacterium]